MDPSEKPAAFQKLLRGDRPRVRVVAVVAAAALMVGIGFVAKQTGDHGAPSPLPSASGSVAAATARPTARPTRTRLPDPTLSATAAPVTAAWLSPTGVLVADTGDPAIGDLAADVDGTVWVTRAGGVVNIDPLTGRAREWTLADDPAFVTNGLAPAQQGGVWLISPDAVRLFDGTRFIAVIDTPGSVWSMVEDADGGLWADTYPYGLVRWADGIWSSAPPGRPSRGVQNMVVDVEGRVWTLNVDRSEEGSETLRGTSVWDGSSWANFAPPELTDTTDGPTSLIASGDGSLWAAMWSHVARFQEGEWASYQVAQLGEDALLSAVDDDGRLWFVRDGCEACGVLINVYDGSEVTTYAAEDGLPGASDVDWSGARVLSGPGYALAATEAGLYRLADGSWRQLDLAARSGSPVPGSSPLGGVIGITAQSRNEVWAVGWPSQSQLDTPVPGLFRYNGTAWHRQQLPVEAAVGRVVLAPDGTLWVATASGPLVLRDGSWSDLGDTVARVVTASETGDDCGGTVFLGPDALVYYAGPRSGNQVVSLLPTGDTWEAELHAAGEAHETCPTSMVATADGAIWALEVGWFNALWRSVDGPWVDVSVPLADQPYDWAGPVAIGVDRDGSLWVAITSYDEAAGVSNVQMLQRVDGDWVGRGSVGDAYFGAFAVPPDGPLIAVGDGIARIDGQASGRWLLGTWFDAVSVAPDGAIWVAGPNIYRLPAQW